MPPFHYKTNKQAAFLIPPRRFLSIAGATDFAFMCIAVHIVFTGFRACVVTITILTTNLLEAIAGCFALLRTGCVTDSGNIRKIDPIIIVKIRAAKFILGAVIPCHAFINTIVFRYTNRGFHRETTDSVSTAFRFTIEI
jgi:hypothetical protein